jgi:hypothetical protein
MIRGAIRTLCPQPVCGFPKPQIIRWGFRICECVNLEVDWTSAGETIEVVRAAAKARDWLQRKRNWRDDNRSLVRTVELDC